MTADEVQDLKERIEKVLDEWHKLAIDPFVSAHAEVTMGQAFAILAVEKSVREVLDSV